MRQPASFRRIGSCLTSRATAIGWSSRWISRRRSSSSSGSVLTRITTGLTSGRCNMAAEIKPIRTEADYDAALAEVERLWGAKAGTARGDRLDVLATLIEAYEERRYPMDPPHP